MRRHVGHLQGHRFCGNIHKLEVHDLDNEQANCQIEEILRAHHERPFVNLNAAHVAGYDNCAWCLGGSLR